VKGTDPISGYVQDAALLIPKYEALNTIDVLGPAAALLPNERARILDVGAGTGRDAAWLAGKGHQVVAVEPVDELRDAGRKLHPSSRIHWIKDRLPLLGTLPVDASYNLILAIGVWQHLMPNDHERAIKVLAKRLAANGRMIVSLRHGPGPRSRPTFPADPDNLAEYATGAGLRLGIRCVTPSLQSENRDVGVTWTWVSFDKP
jgi:SAM-dependent methyltransferase